MKSLKNHLLIIGNLMLLALSIQSNITAGGADRFAETAAKLSEKKWHDAYGPGFEIQNKANTPIWVSIARNNDLDSTYEIAKNSKKSLAIQSKEPITLGVYTKKPTVSPIGFVLDSFLGTQPDHIYSINAPGKTKYLTWNPEKYKNNEKSFYPQTGTYLGLSGKTDSGQSLAANINQADINYKSKK